MKILTEQHLHTARMMPRKDRPRTKNARQIIAQYYRTLRADPENGMRRARRRHYFGVVTDRKTAKEYLANMEALK